MADLPKPDFDGVGDLDGPRDIIKGAKPKKVDGPLGLPMVVPEAFPDPPSPGSDMNPLDRY